MKYLESVRIVVCVLHLYLLGYIHTTHALDTTRVGSGCDQVQDFRYMDTCSGDPAPRSDSCANWCGIRPATYAVWTDVLKTAELEIPHPDHTLNMCNVNTSLIKSLVKCPDRTCNMCSVNVGICCMQYHVIQGDVVMGFNFLICSGKLNYRIME